MTASSARRQRRSAERARKAAGVALVERRHLPAGIAPHPARLVHLIDLALTALDAKGGDLGSMVAITIGQHPEYPGEITVEAKVAAMKPQGWINIDGVKTPVGVTISVAPVGTHPPAGDCEGCPIDHSADSLDDEG